MGGSEASSTEITWYDAENDRLIFDSFGNTLNHSGGAKFNHAGHALRPFPSPGTSPNLELGLKNFMKHENYNQPGFYSDYLTSSRISADSMYYSVDNQMSGSVSTPTSSDSSSYSSSSSYMSRAPIPANVIQATPVVASTQVERAIPSIAIPLKGSTLATYQNGSGSATCSNLLNIIPNSQRNVFDRKVTSSSAFRSMSSPEIAQGTIAVATVLETPSMDRKIYVATPIEYDMHAFADDNDSSSTEIESGQTLTGSIVFRSL